MHRLILALCVSLATLSAPVAAGTTVDLAAEATRNAPNDLARATIFAEAGGNSPAEVAKRVNAMIGGGLRLAKTYPAVRTRSGATHTYPVYGKGEKIEGWRMRSELAVESTDMTALSELLGKLQTSLGVSQLSLMPADETRRSVEEAATLEAMAAFQARAAKVAKALGKTYRIKHLSLNLPQRPPVMPMLRSATMMTAEAAPMPVEAGESQVTVSVTGQIELSD